MANEADDSSSKLVEQAAPSAQFPPLQRNLDQLEALSEKLKSKTLRTEAPSQSIAATRLLAREGLNDEQLARDLKSFELKAALGGAVGKIQRIHAFLRSIEIQKRVGAFSAALVTINKCLFAAIGALSRGRLDGESRTAGLIHSGNELVESFKCYPEVRKDTCKACWKDEMGMAEIVSSKGRLLTTIGIVRDGKIYFSIEETLYMAEVGALHLLHDDICLSLEEIYKMVSQGRYGCCWESFEVYKHLKSLGYIVSRHGVPWTLSHLTKNDSILNEATTKTNLKRDSEYEDTAITIKLFKSMHIDKVKPVFDVYAPNSKFRKSSPGNPNFVCLTSSLPPSKQEISDLERRCSGIPLKLCNVEHGRVTVFSFNTVELPILP